MELNLLLLDSDGKKHYVLIKDFNSFMFKQTKHKSKKNFCMNCLQCFSSKEVLDAHRKDCIVINGKQAIKMPNEDENEVEFINHRKQIPVPFVIYADFEAITNKNKKSVVNELKDKGNVSYTKAYQTHVDCGYGYKVVCHYDWKLSKRSKIYRGKGAVYKFMENMLEEVEYCKKMVKRHFNKNLKATNDNLRNFNESSECYICKVKYVEGEKPIMDHCRITGKYMGSAHDACCSKLRMNPDKIRVPVIFHNLRGYDSHLTMQQIGKIAKDKSYVDKNGERKNLKINAIPNNMERYMAFMLGNNLTFVDSFQFMSSSLDKLDSNMRKEDLKYTSTAFYGYKLDLMSKKGIYPYDFINSMEKFENKELPKIEDFYSTLNEEHISEKDYNHAKEVWNAFRIKNMGEYHDLYLQSDILLLTDVFENFRNTCMQYYGLDPCHYFTSPGLSWDAMLKMTKVKLELMTDINMYQFIEKGMRGGVSYIANRYGKANNKYMEGYDEKKPSKYIMYLDANNLYGWAMIQYLSYSSFKWLSNEELNNIDLGKYKEDANDGLILEVDLEYPKDLHELHNDYPLAPEKVKVSKDMLSEYCNKISEKYKIPFGVVNKLIPMLNNKKEYVVHYRNLQLYMDLGLKVTKVHRALKFKQSPCLKQCIDFNTNKRKEANTSFEKDFFKLMNNSIFGKTMENLRKRVDVRLVTEVNQFIKLTSKPTFVSSKIFNKNLVAVHKIKETLKLNRPAYVGMCILDLSKTLMYDFHYNYIKKEYGSRAKLLFTDTDSLTYEIATEDVYKDLWKRKELFDNSDYPKGSPYKFQENKKVIGKFKDESCGKIISEFVGLRSKMYSYIMEDGKGGMTAKGIKKNTIKKNIMHEDYKNTLLNEEQRRHKIKTIRSVKHKLQSFEINKISLSCFDDKCYIHDNGTSSYAHGHYKIK